MGRLPGKDGGDRQKGETEVTKEQIIKGAIALINHVAKEKGLTVEDRGTGHAFDNSFWNFTDKSQIPTVIASDNVFSIKLRPFWSSPEIDVRRDVDDGEELLIFNFSDSVEKDGEYRHTGDWHVHEVRVDARWDYKACIEEVYEMIDFVIRKGTCQEKGETVAC